MNAPSADTSPGTRIETIARLNDRCRMGLDRTARIVMTNTCLATFAPSDPMMAIVVQAQICAALRRYEFTGADALERDRGNFEYRGMTVYFTICYYDAELGYGSEDPADASKTCRVLTIMLREDL
jgi:hypothetical protein